MNSIDLEKVNAGKCILVPFRDSIEISLVREKIVPGGWFSKAQTTKYLEKIGTVTYAVLTKVDPQEVEMLFLAVLR